MASIFDADQVIDPEKNYHEELVGEGKKYKDDAALARSRVEADLHIGNLQKETAQMREELDQALAELKTRKNMEDLLDQWESRRQSDPAHTPTPADGGEGPHRNDNQPDVESLIQQKLDQLTKSQRESANLADVSRALKEQYGPNFAEVVKAKAEELGVGVKFFEDIARETPQAFMAYFPQERPEGREAPGARTNPGTTVKAHNWAYYKELRDKDPTAFNSWKVLQQMENDLRELGEEKFYA